MKIYFIIILIVFCSNSYCQFEFLPNPKDYAEITLPENIKQIKRFENDSVLLSIREYDREQNLIFSYGTQHVNSRKFKGTRLIFIKGYIYNEQGQKLKVYHLHSNVGISIWDYEYDTLHHVTRILQKDYEYDNHKELINTNPYYFISNIQSFNELLNDTLIKKIEGNSIPYLIFAEQYDSIGNMHKQISFEQNGDTSNVRQFIYDNYNKPIYLENKKGDRIESESYYAYNHNDFVLDGDPITGNLIQNVRIIFSHRTNQKKVSSITFYKYDFMDRIEEIITHTDGELSSRKKYIYDFDNNFESQESYDSDGTITYITSYGYDEYGNVIYKIVNNHKSGEIKESKYNYEFDFYDEE